MNPKSDPALSHRHQRRLFVDDSLLREFVNMEHELVRLGDRMRWEIFENQGHAQFSDTGGPMAHPARRVADLLMLQHMEKLSDERLNALWVSSMQLRPMQNQLGSCLPPFTLPPVCASAAASAFLRLFDVTTTFCSPPCGSFTRNSNLSMNLHLLVN